MSKGFSQFLARSGQIPAKFTSASIGQLTLQATPRGQVAESLPEVTEAEALLVRAIRDGDLFNIQALLRDRADPNTSLRGGESLLLSAAKTGDLNVVTLLLSSGATPCVDSALPVVGTSVCLLCDIFREECADSEDRRDLLASLDPGVLAHARKYLNSPGPFALGGTAPAACIITGFADEYAATDNHQITLHFADSMRPLLALTPARQSPSATVVLLHGMFQSGQMLENLARELAEDLPYARLLAPTAPTRVVSSPFEVFGVGPAWHNPFDTAMMLGQLEDSREELLQLMSLEHKTHGVAPGRVVLLGFSLGGALAAWTALRSSCQLAGVVLLSTHFDGSVAEAAVAEAAFAEAPGGPRWPGAPGLSMLHCHGAADRVVSEKAARAGVAWLRDVGSEVCFSSHDGVGHSLSPAMVAEVSAWLAARLPEENNEACFKSCDDAWQP